MRELWERTDFNPIAARNTLTGELLVRAADVHSGERVLDVAAGTGNTALAAARRGARVTASDFAPALLKTAARRAEVESLELMIEYGDVQDLPFDDDTFDVVTSSFGAMFAPDQQRAASELTRVCRPGGRIAIANWAPNSVVAKVQAATATEPAPGPSPLVWGTEDGCRTLFGDRVTTITSTVRAVEFFAPSAMAHVEFLEEHLGPFQAQLESVDEDTRQRWKIAAANEFERVNRATDGTLIACAEYLELVAVTA